MKKILMIILLVLVSFNVFAQESFEQALNKIILKQVRQERFIKTEIISVYHFESKSTSKVIHIHFKMQHRQHWNQAKEWFGSMDAYNIVREIYLKNKITKNEPISLIVVWGYLQFSDRSKWDIAIRTTLNSEDKKVNTEEYWKNVSPYNFDWADEVIETPGINF